MEPQVIDTASHILRSQLRLSKSELLCFRNPLGLQYLASFFRPPFQRQITNLTRCSFPVKASKSSQPVSAAPSVFLRLLPRDKPSGEGSEKLCRSSVKRKWKIRLHALNPRPTAQPGQAKGTTTDRNVPLVRARPLYCVCKLLRSDITGPIFRAATSLMREASKPWLTADGRVRRTRLVAQGLPSKFLRLISNRSRLHQQLRAFVHTNPDH